MIFIVDSGSTKCDWLAIDMQGNQLLEKQRTRGMNPAILSPSKLEATIRSNPVLIANKNIVSHVFFYGAGCGTEKPRLMLETVLSTFFPNAKVDVKEDTYAAVYATVGQSHDPAVVCIMGTGSNCSYFDDYSMRSDSESDQYRRMCSLSSRILGKTTRQRALLTCLL